MLPLFFHWYYILVPKWLIIFFWHLELALLRFFSVGFMLKTLLAPWRRDLVSYQGISLEEMVTVFAWNQISRLIGFIIRGLVLAIWAAAQAFYLILSIGVFFLYLLWPLLITISLVSGLLLML